MGMVVPIRSTCILWKVEGVGVPGIGTVTMNDIQVAVIVEVSNPGGGGENVLFIVHPELYYLIGGAYGDEHVIKTLTFELIPQLGVDDKQGLFAGIVSKAGDYQGAGWIKTQGMVYLMEPLAPLTMHCLVQSSSGHTPWA